ncbi:MAG: lytic transglycosylase domain-containing protein [Candidatus Nanoarchaeia archaeon]
MLLAVLILLILITSLFIRIDYSYFFRSSKDFDRIIENASRRHGIDPCLVKAVIWRESRFNPNARGSKGEIGLMQIRMNYSAADWSEKNGIPIPCEGVLFHPEINIEIGSWYLSRARKRWKDFEHSTEMALAEYNAGFAGMKKWIPETTDANILERIQYEPTKEYVSAIMEQYESYIKKRTEP